MMCEKVPRSEVAWVVKWLDPSDSPGVGRWDVHPTETIARRRVASLVRAGFSVLECSGTLKKYVASDSYGRVWKYFLDDEVEEIDVEIED